MKDITFKQVLQYLKGIEDDRGFKWLIIGLIDKRLRGYKQYFCSTLNHDEYKFLEEIGFTPKFREDIQEWEINLIDND